MAFLSYGSRRPAKQSPNVGRSIGPPPTVSELCTLLVFLLDVIPLVGPLLSRDGSVLAVVYILIWGVGLFLNLILPRDFSHYSSVGKESPCNAGDLGSIPGSGRSSGEGNGNPLQYSCLENPHGQRSLVGYSPWGLRVRHNLVTKPPPPPSY